MRSNAIEVTNAIDGVNFKKAEESYGPWTLTRSVKCSNLVRTKKPEGKLLIQQARGGIEMDGKFIDLLI